VGLVLAAVPVLPLADEWNFYGQSGICIPLPFTGATASSSSSSLAAYSYSFSVLVVLNFVLFLLIAIGQVTFI
jgi:hypothetical protein